MTLVKNAFHIKSSAKLNEHQIVEIINEKRKNILDDAFALTLKHRTFFLSVFKFDIGFFFLPNILSSI